MCFSKMAVNIMHTYLAKIQTDKTWELIKTEASTLKFEDIPAIGKEDNAQFHAFQRSEIKYGQIQSKMNGAI